MSNVTRISDYTRSASGWTVEECLEDSLKEIREGTRKANRLLVIFLDTTDGKYHVGYSRVGNKLSDEIGLLEVVKRHIINGMFED